MCAQALPKWCCYCTCFHIYMHAYIYIYIHIYIYICTYIYICCYCTCFQGQRGKPMSRCGRASTPQRSSPPACYTPSCRSKSWRTSQQGARFSPTMGTPFGQRPKSTIKVCSSCLSFIYLVILYVCVHIYINISMIYMYKRIPVNVYDIYISII